MADNKHLAILGRGVAAWNAWREGNPEIHPNLRKAELSGTDLSGVNFSGADLSAADLSKANLTGANLFRADLTQATLFLSNLSGADLTWANFRVARLTEADLSRANLTGTDLTEARLRGARFDGAIFSSTTIAATELCLAKGLEEIRHGGASYVDVNTILSQEKPLPDVFLRGIGLSDSFIAYMPSLSPTPVQFYSCFISYDSRDEQLAERLHSDFGAAGIRCWKWNVELRIGERIWPSITEAIRSSDKLVVILSEASLNNRYVLNEIRAGLEKGEDTKSTVLFPIAIDDYWRRWKNPLQPFLAQIQILNLKEWDKDPAKYKAGISELIRALAITTANDWRKLGRER